MGVVNATPDSFSDGGQGEPLERARDLISAGADWLDIGGESTRPGAAPVDEAEELARVIPLIREVRAASAIPISIDTMKPVVASAAVGAGATMWNDVSALSGGGESVAAAAKLGCQVVLMHMRGEPATMQDDPRYDDVVGEVMDFLAARAAAVEAAGVARGAIWLDPGLGFGKTAAHSLALIGALPRLVALGYPVLLGASRKGFIRVVDTSATDPLDRLGGSLAAALAGARAGVAMVRAHDVRQTVQALAMARSIGEATRHG